MSAHLAGELGAWPDKERLAAILRAAGFEVRVGPYSLRLEDLSHFVVQEYGGDRGVPRIEADADTAEQLLRESRRVSEALARAGIRHRFEIYDDDRDEETLAGYWHHEWPLEGVAEPTVPDVGQPDPQGAPPAGG